MDISKIDKNFALETKLEREGLVFLDAEEAPFQIYGVFREGDRFCRMPGEVAKSTSEGVAWLATHTAGGRVRFVTDSPFIAISAQVDNSSRLPHFPFTGSIGFDFYTGTRYLHTFVPPVEVTDSFEGIRETDGVLREYTVNFPLYSDVKKLHIGLKEGCRLEAAPAYRVEKPVVYYGSSITQGGCASRPGNSYESILSRELDCDYVNLGFSGSAKAEPAIQDYIAELPMSVFVYDYDYNAPTFAHLEATHEQMFLRFRASQPDTPVVILSRPQYYLSPEEQSRKALIRRTYENALAAGDKNVYFIPGDELILPLVRDSALVDNTHPNDSGFVSMAHVLGKLLKELLG